MTAMMRWGIPCLIAAVFFSSRSEAAPDQRYTFVWVPRATDVGPPGSNAYQTLSGVLKLVPTVDYTVLDGDNFDFIIRKTFLVSQSLHHAYTLYGNRIAELNPGIDFQRLRIGQVLHMPIGPRYEATELAKESIPQPAFRSTFDALSTQACALPEKSSDARIRTCSTRALAAFVSPFKNITTNAAFGAIVNRGLVAAVDSQKHPGSTLPQLQAYDLTITSDEERGVLGNLKATDPHSVLPGMLPMSTSVPVACLTCKGCASAINIPVGTDLSHARVLVEDTGVNPGIAASGNLLQQFSGGDGKDLDAQSHGTFVFSEIAAPNSPDESNIVRGVIPKSQVYVVRVVQKDNSDPSQLNFSMTDIVKGWQSFVTTMSRDAGAAATWVVNLSEAGTSPIDTDQSPNVWYRDHLLVVAAAGNHHSNAEPRFAPFGLYSTGGFPLLIVGALDVDGKQTSYSNFDSQHVQLFAQGDCMCGAPGQISGTSQAAPIVTIAAAALASSRPELQPAFVMWRLISTADHSPGLQPNGAFGGVVNLKRALDRNILIEEGGSPTTVTLHRATSIKFSAGWGNAIVSANLDGQNVELLRLYKPSAGPVPGEICFTAIQMGDLVQPPLCTSSDSTLSYVEGGVARQPISVSQVQDLILPIGLDRDSGQVWPSVGIAAGE